ncbi:MAG: ABC transporter ATP-binding protein [archaeon]|nr:ABC transporter ATP-binding protein [archaeon]
MEMRLENLGFSYGDIPVFKGINVTLNDCELVCILGPNGAGKSTLMHCMNRILTPTEGKVYIDGKDIASYSLRELAKVVSFVPHSEDTTFSMTVLDTALTGRLPHSGDNPKEEDICIAAENLKLLGMHEYALHNFDELSAGQHQKVMIARSLTQEPKIMLLDEPTSNLDVKYQMLVMRLLRDVARLKKITVITICHDLNVTARYADRILMLYNQTIFADGTPNEVLTRENVKTVYGIDCEILEMQGRPLIALLDGDELDSHIEERMIKHQ